MLTKRIIPCLDIKDGQTVKGVNFFNLKTVGDPVELAKKYANDGADELVFLDITATNQGRKTFAELVKRIAANINIPFTVGGGISSVEDADILLSAGADKISINSAAVKNPALIGNLKEKFGSQFVVVAIDAKCINDKWIVTTHGGTKETDKELFSWANEVQKLGAGEILFTSMNNDGTQEGFACEACKKLSGLLNIPLIASGGAGCKEDFADVLCNDCGADAALAASLFHYGTLEIKDLKEYLKTRNIPVRL